MPWRPARRPGSRTGPFWIYDFGLRAETPAWRQRPRGDGKEQFEQALCALWRGEIEDDGFNALVLDAGLAWRDVVVLRAYARYLRQAGNRFSQGYIQRVLRSNTTVTRLLARLFASRFDPARQGGEAERSEAIVEEIRGELDDVVSLDHDRILQSYLALIGATLRTNHYRTAAGPGGPGGAGGSACAAPAYAPYLVIKLDPGQVASLPEPRPKFEIFVYSPRLEAVHLRFGRVARGGLRWSDRLEDFRTEVLGLVKAQEVKNAVIVPSGAKGGFVCKQLPDPGRPRGLPGRGAGLLPDVHQRHARHHRQRGRRAGAPAARRGPARRRRPVPGRRGGQGHRDLLRRGQRDRGQLRVLAGRRVRLRRLRGLRPQEDGHHRARRLGVGQEPLRHARHEPGHRRVHGGRHR